MAKVLVACKIPNGLILRLFKPEEVDYPLLGGGYKRVTEYKPIPGAQVELAGPATPFGQMPNAPVAAGYAITPVEKDFWDKWLEQNKDAAVVENGLVFASEKQGNVVAQARDNRKNKVKSGLEQIDPANPPQAGISMRGMRVQTDEDMDKSQFLPTAEEMSDRPSRVKI